jgi:hypothetical protein
MLKITKNDEKMSMFKNHTFKSGVHDQETKKKLLIVVLKVHPGTLIHNIL